jgi:hypothetical protein
MCRISDSQHLLQFNSPSQQFPSAQPNRLLSKMNFFIFAIFCSIAALAFGRDVGDVLGSGQTLENGETLLSADGRFRLLLQADGDLVMVNLIEGYGNKIQWRAKTAGSGAVFVIMARNGDLCLGNKNGVVVWHTVTFDAGSYVKMQGDGNLVIESPKGYSPWCSATAYAKP